MEINYHLLTNSVVVSFDGGYYPISEEDYRYASVVEAIKNGDIENLPNLVTVEKAFSDKENGLEFRDNTVFINGEAIPEELSDRVMEFKRQGLPYEYLLKFALKLKDNPSFNSRRMLYTFLEHNGHPITKDGNFIAYRGVTKNFRDYHSGRFDNSVGAVCEMPREKVDDDPNRTCSAGLHVACYSYASTFGSGGVVVEVEVDPRDVVCVPVDYNGTKMRVCKFVVKAVCKNERVNEQIYRWDEEEDWEDDDESVWSEGQAMSELW